MTSPHMWTRRAALVMTLPWTKQNHPKPQDLNVIRDRHAWLVPPVTATTGENGSSRKPIPPGGSADLSKHDAPRARALAGRHGDRSETLRAERGGAKYL